MKILFLDWNGYGNEDMKGLFSEEGIKVDSCLLPDGISTSRESADRLLRDKIKNGGYDFAFSLNYFPVVSELCEEFGLDYVSWVYDSPYIHVYSYTVINKCNYIFLFDYAVYRELADEGISTVYYLPLAVNIDRLEMLRNRQRNPGRYVADISFVGSLYDEDKHRLYDRFKGIAPYAKGYLDAVIQAQKRIYGYNFVREVLASDIVEEMQKVYPTDPDSKTVMSPEAIYADYVLLRQVTAEERRDILRLMGETFPGYKIDLYTHNRNTRIGGVNNCGPVDYYSEMPYVFMNSKINLNITLRSIKTGIPLRVFDILGCGGFLITNYQAELAQYFDLETDMICYNDYDDLMGKTEYYLSHDAERREIAENGCMRIKEAHTMRHRIREMLDIIQNE